MPEADDHQQMGTGKYLSKDGFVTKTKEETSTPRPLPRYQTPQSLSRQKNLSKKGWVEEKGKYYYYVKGKRKRLDPP